MEIQVINNQNKIRIPNKKIQNFIDFIAESLKTQQIANISESEIIIVFIDNVQMKKMNKAYRGKNYATDILSFSSEEEGVLGELVLAPQVLKAQAQENNHTFQAELAYMLIHGVLHLLGYDHEVSKRKAKIMFKIQDQLFDNLCVKFKI